MGVSYGEAALRHWEDAAFLSGDGRAHNADQLYGLAAECALKRAMTALGASTESDGTIEKRYRAHIDKLWSEYLAFASGRRGARYTSLLGKFTHNPFSDWSIDQRYASAEPHLSGSTCETHKRAAGACLAVLRRVQEDVS